MRRLKQAPEALTQFIRSCWQIAGFEYAVKAFFGNRLQKQTAIMAIRLTRLVAERNTVAKAQMVFTQDIGYAPEAGAFLSLQMELNGRHFILLPWTELDERTIKRQFACHRKLFGNSNAFRWVLSARALGMQKDDVMQRLANIFTPNTYSDEEGNEVKGLKRLAIVLP